MAKGLMKRLEGRPAVPQALTLLALQARLIGLTSKGEPVAVHHKHGIRRGLKGVNRLGLRGARLALYDAAYEADRADYTPEWRERLAVALDAYTDSLLPSRPAHVEQRYHEKMRRVGKSAFGSGAQTGVGGARHG